MAQEGGQERTEQATSKRLHDAREKGQIPRSRELGTFAVLAASGALMWSLGGAVTDGLLAIMKKYFSPSRELIFDQYAMVNSFSGAVWDALRVLAPAFALLAVVAVLATLAVGGWNFSAQAVAFKWEKLDPVKGVRKLFSWRALVELAKALMKFGVVLAAAIAVLWYMSGEIAALGGAEPAAAIAETGRIITSSFLLIGGALILVALVDVPFQLWDHGKQLRMTRQEVKDEHKETDGNPEVRAKVRAIQREMARRRMMAEVPKADVVITNPTHFAVALKYDEKNMRAPRLVAKGADLVAARIRHVAQESGVPIMSSPVLARAVYYSTEINKEIPAGLYVAVAQVLAYVFQLRQRKQRVDENAFRDKDMDIPEELKVKGGE